MIVTTPEITWLTKDRGLNIKQRVKDKLTNLKDEFSEEFQEPLEDLS